MSIKNEIMYNFIDILKTSSSDLKEAEYLAEYDPEKYISDGLYKKIEFTDITNRLLDKLIQSNSGLFFHFNLDKISDFKKYIKRAALFVASQNPLLATLTYKLHKNPELQNDAELSKVLLIGLLDVMGANTNDLSDAHKSLDDPKLKNEVLSIVENIAKHDPDFYQESKLAEDSEFGKFFHYIGKKQDYEKISYI